MEILSNYFNSLIGKEPKLHRFDHSLFYVIAAVFAGYTLTAAHPKFLKHFENPIVQFIIFYINGITWYAGEVPPGGFGGLGFKTLWAGPYVFLDSILAVVFIQAIVYFSHKLYKK